MIGGSSRPARKIHIIGNKGEIQGRMEDGFFVVRHPDPGPENEYLEEKVNVSVVNDMHGGGDLRLVEDFVRVINGKKPSISTTSLENSIYGHLIGFRADKSMNDKKVYELELY